MKIGRNPSTQTHLRHLVEHAELCEVEPEEDMARVAAVRKATRPSRQADGRRQTARGARRWRSGWATRSSPTISTGSRSRFATDDIEGSARRRGGLGYPDRRLRTEIGLYASAS